MINETQPPPESCIEKEPWKSADFTMGKFLGSGKFGVVYLAIDKKSGCEVAIKRLDKEFIKNYKMTKQLRREIEVHTRLRHKHILKMFAYFQEDKYVYQVLEYAENGTLYSKLTKEKTFSEDMVAKYVFQIASALGYLHTRSVIHRDLKLENILLDANDDTKIGDFGWTVHSIEDKRGTICGTIDYLAPELVNHEKYDSGADIWCLGVIMYEMLYGCPPFGAATKAETMDRIKERDLIFYDDIAPTSELAKDLLLKLLDLDPSKRIIVTDIFTHPFFNVYPQTTTNTI
jgi:aurora kinase/aurora kinase A